MGKTLWSSLILQVTLILFLNSSHARGNYFDEIPKSYFFGNLENITKNEALDIANIVYNLHSKDANISKIVINRLEVVDNMANGDVELRPTTCTRAESVLDECPFKAKLILIQATRNLIRYMKLNKTEKTCSKFKSELSNCPLSEHTGQQKRELCLFSIDISPLRMNMIFINFKCKSV